MAIVTLTTILNGTLADASIVMANFNAIIAQVNGNLDATNLANSAVTNAKLDSSLQGPLVLTAGVAKKINKGTASVSFSASASGSVTFAHGLGSVPGQVILTAYASLTAAAGSKVMAASTLTVDATNIQINVRNVAGVSITETINVAWMAIEI